MKKLFAILLFIPYIAFSQSSEPLLIPLFKGQMNGVIDPAELSTNDSIIIVSDVCKNESFKVLGFWVNIRCDYGDIWEINNHGNKFNAEIIAIFKRLPVDTRISLHSFKIFTGTDTVISTRSTMFKIDGLKACVYTFPDDIETRFIPCLDSNERRIIGKERIQDEGNISRKNLLHNQHILVARKETEDSRRRGIDINYQIVQYEMIMQDAHGRQIAKISAQSDAIPKKAQQLIRRNKRISHIRIDNVVASDAKGNKVNVGSLRLMVM